jgi:DNA-binding transcriptional ArsR family regulator
MADREPFLLVSLDEEKAKKLAQVISNETCTKLLNHLAQKHESTETDIANDLKLPLSTVHYNLKQLVEAKLVVADEYHYSEKGREVLHYKLANRYIIIAPAEEKESFLSKLKGFLPVTLITLGAAAVLKVFGIVNGTARFAAVPQAAPSLKSYVPDQSAAIVENVAENASARIMATAAPSAAGASVNDATLTMMQEVPNATAPAPPIAMPSPSVSPPQVAPSAVAHPLLSNEVILAFLVGALFVIAVLVLLAYVRHKRGKRS